MYFSSKIHLGFLALVCLFFQVEKYCLQVNNSLSYSETYFVFFIPTVRIDNHKQSLKNPPLQLHRKLFHEMNGWNFDSLTGKLILVHLKFLFCPLSCFHLKGKERKIMCIHKDKFYFLVTSPLGSCCLCDVPCSDNNDSWFLCCSVRLFGWKTTCIFAYSILLVWHWEVCLLTMSHWKYRISELEGT